jgi:hypothetical protein
MRTGYLATTALAVTIALIAKDLTLPLAGIAAFGLIDRIAMAFARDIRRNTISDPARLQGR